MDDHLLIALILTGVAILTHIAMMVLGGRAERAFTRAREINEETKMLLDGHKPRTRGMIRVSGDGTLAVSVEIPQIDRAFLRRCADTLWQYTLDLDVDPDCPHDSEVLQRWQRISTGMQIAADGHYADGAAALYHTARAQAEPQQVSGICALAKIVIHCAANEAAETRSEK